MAEPKPGLAPADALAKAAQAAAAVRKAARDAAAAHYAQPPVPPATAKS